MFTVNRNPSRDDLRKFGWGMLAGFTLLAGIVWYLHARRHDLPLSTWTGSSAQIMSAVFVLVGVSLCAVGLAAPQPAGRAVYVAWMSATVPIGIAMSTVLLTALFVLLLPVFSLIVRLGDPLRKKLGATTYWEDYKHYEPTLERMKRPF